VDKLLNVKGVPKKVLEKLVAERPFHSEKAVLNIKGVGPVMLKKIVSELTR
jgi:DNA uptake protein ComE-like DNA-binding protein